MEYDPKVRKLIFRKNDDSQKIELSVPNLPLNQVLHPFVAMKGE